MDQLQWRKAETADGGQNEVRQAVFPEYLHTAINIYREEMILQIRTVSISHVHTLLQFDLIFSYSKPAWVKTGGPTIIMGWGGGG